MFFDEIIHGTQYYRAPTPLPDEWEGDIAKLENINVDAIQIRINWRWNEKREDDYDFSDVDALLSIAENYGKKVIIKFLLECAPQYVFEKYGGTRIGPKGEQLRGGSHGAFYGGWRPCFTNPFVQERAVKFVEQVAKRYANRPSIILWNAWNEIRNKPVEDCFCPHCRKAFGEHLKEKFGTIEALNEFYGTAEESFGTINLPMMAHGVWDIFAFKKFKSGADLQSWLRFVYEAIRKYDPVRPIMAHVGYTAAYQDNLGDLCDDYTVSKAVDFWGTSIPCSCSMQTQEERLDYMMTHDFQRSIDENYFSHEIYPGLGMFKWYDEPFDMKFKLYAALSSGTKGINYWQYRAERIGHEADCAGLVRMDGTPRPVTEEVKKFGKDLRANGQYFVGASVTPAQIGIVFDYDSSLLSIIEDHCGVDYSFAPYNPLYYYRRAHAGMYRMLRRSNYAVDYVGSIQTERFERYKVLYFPYHTMLSPETVAALRVFLAKGGIVIADEGFGMRQQNTWMQPYDIACKPLMSARMQERRFVTQETINIGGKQARVRPYKTQYRVEEGETLLQFADGSPALQKVNYGKGSIYLFGCSPAYSYYETGDEAWKSFIESILESVGVEKFPYADFENGVYEKRMQNGRYEILFLFNNTQEKKTFTLEKAPIAAGAKGKLQGNFLFVPAMDVAYVVFENETA